MKGDTRLVPDLILAEELLREAGELNPGEWVPHSRNVAYAARSIAERLAGLDSAVAYSLGLLHDIGRREGKTQIRHIIDGYRYLMGLGYEDAARICLTHSFPIQDIRTSSARWDCSPEETEFMKDFLSRIEYDDYDRLIQLCDGIATSSGFCLLEQRMVNVAMRHGVNEFTVEKWKARFKLKAEFERALGVSVYSLLPGVVEVTFGFVSGTHSEGA